MTQAHRHGFAAALIAAMGALASAQTGPAPTPTPGENPATPPAAAAPATETPTAPPAAASATPTAAPTPVPPTPVPTGPPPRRLIESPAISVSRLSAENPYGTVVEEPATLPAKLAFGEVVVPASLFAAVRVDPTGKVVQSRLVRDPIPSLAAESRRSFEQRWSFDPAVKGGQPAETWASVRLDFQVEVRVRDAQPTLTPVTPATPLPSPVEWGDDTKWYESYRVNPPTDGTVPLEQVDTPPIPKKTKWSADSFKGPYSCRFWIRVTAGGQVDKVIPIQVSDPVLIASMRRAAGAWVLKPAKAKGQPVDSWNELAISGQVSYSIDVKQVNTLRKTLATP
jgi:protein TonB